MLKHYIFLKVTYIQHLKYVKYIRIQKKKQMDNEIKIKKATGQTFYWRNQEINRSVAGLFFQQLHSPWLPNVQTPSGFLLQNPLLRQKSIGALHSLTVTLIRPLGTSLSQFICKKTQFFSDQNNDALNCFSLACNVKIFDIAFLSY